MKTSLVKSGLLLLAAGIFISSCEKKEKESETPESSVLIEDMFKKDANGWTIVGDAQGGYAVASYSPDGGVTDGYIFAKDDAIGGVWYFNAPKPYLGDQSIYYDATLNFSLFQDSRMSNQFEFEDIVFKSNDKQLFYKYASKNDFPKKEWINYSIKINANTPGWYVGKYKDKYNGPEKEYTKATEAEMKEILSNITAFWIRGEFETGPDTGGLDNVQLSR